MQIHLDREQSAYIVLREGQSFLPTSCISDITTRTAAATRRLYSLYITARRLLLLKITVLIDQTGSKKATL